MFGLLSCMEMNHIQYGREKENTLAFKLWCRGKIKIVWREKRTNDEFFGSLGEQKLVKEKNSDNLAYN